MPRKTNNRRSRGRRPRANVGAFKNPGWTENVIADCSMSSTTNNFRMTYAKLVPSLQATARPLRLQSVSISIPPVPYTVESAIVQLFMVDQVTSALVPMIAGKVLSTTNPRTVRFRVPRIFERFNTSNSTDIAFVIQFRFPVNQTFKSYCRIVTKWFVSFDPLTDTTPLRANEFEDQPEGEDTTYVQVEPPSSSSVLGISRQFNSLRLGQLGAARTASR